MKSVTKLGRIGTMLGGIADIKKLSLFDYPDILVYVDRFCPECGSPLSVKRANGVEVETCLNQRCSYFRMGRSSKALPSDE